MPEIANLNPRGARVGRGMRIHENINTSATDWMRDGLCAQPGADPEAWFRGFETDPHKMHTPPSEDTLSMHSKGAKALCHGCPILTRCALFAVQNKLDHGVWGGMTPYMRARNGERMLAAAREAGLAS